MHIWIVPWVRLKARIKWLSPWTNTLKGSAPRFASKNNVTPRCAIVSPQKRNTSRKNISCFNFMAVMTPSMRHLPRLFVKPFSSDSESFPFHHLQILCCNFQNDFIISSVDTLSLFENCIFLEGLHTWLGAEALIDWQRGSRLWIRRLDSSDFKTESAN